jgi:hypothetical protein
VASRSVGHGQRFRLVDLPFTKWVFLALLVVIVAATALELRHVAGLGRGIVMAASALMLSTITIGLVFIELISVWFFPQFLPSTLRRLTIGVAPLFGIWLAIIGSAVILISATISSEAIAAWANNLGQGIRKKNPAWLALLFLIVGIPLIVFARDLVWLRLQSTSSDVKWALPGWAMPWLGIFTLVLLFIALALGALFISRQMKGGGVALAITGWAMTVPAALLLVLARAIPHVTAPGWLRDHLSHWSVQAHQIPGAASVIPKVPTRLTAQLTAGSGPILFIVAGSLIAVAGLLICRAQSVGSM